MLGSSAKPLPKGVPDCLKKRRLLNDKEEIIRIVTAQALARIGGPEALTDLERLCNLLGIHA